MYLNMESTLADKLRAAQFDLDTARRDLGLVLLRRAEGWDVSRHDVDGARARLAERKQEVDDAEATIRAFGDFKQEVRDRAEQEAAARKATKPQPRRPTDEEFGAAWKHFYASESALRTNATSEERSVGIEEGTALFAMAKLRGQSSVDDCIRRFAELRKLPELHRLR